MTPTRDIVALLAPSFPSPQATWRHIDRLARVMGLTCGSGGRRQWSTGELRQMLTASLLVREQSVDFVQAVQVSSGARDPAVSHIVLLGDWPIDCTTPEEAVAVVEDYGRSCAVVCVPTTT